MDLCFENCLEVNETLVSNEFIDKYMADANGEYVKVYLYILRHSREPVSVGAIADALNHTEADVRRALGYWQKAGVLTSQKAAPEEAQHKAGETDSQAAREQSAAAAAAGVIGKKAGEASPVNGDAKATPQPGERPHCSEKEIAKLSKDGDFSQLIYIAQKYMNKAFTPVDCEIFAYLYGNLHMPVELLEYLVEYCVQNNHTSLRYIEKVALNWHERGLLTVEEAKAYSNSFSKDAFAVMKAFGLTGRGPGEKEYEDIIRWFKEYGFTKELVVEACNRTMEAIHTPSFQYAEQILKDWRQAKVRSRKDVEILDQSRQEQRLRDQKGKENGGQSVRRAASGKPANRFHNLEDHGYDYDKMVWSMITSGQNSD